MPWLLNRVSFSAAIIAVSIAVHIGFVGVIVLADRRVLPRSELASIDVDLVKPEELEPPKTEPPKQEPKPEQARPPEPEKPAKQTQSSTKSEPPKSQAKSAAPQPEQQPEAAQAEPAQPEEAPPKPADIPQGGAPGEGKSKLTPEEIAALRAQIQKCWKLPVGIPGVMGLEVVIRVPFGPKGQIAGEPVLLQAPAHERGPILVGIALNALRDCYPFKLPPAKYADWKSLDLKFTATGMAGIAPRPKNLPKGI